MKNWKRLCLAAALALSCAMAGCSAPQQDSVEDPLSSFSIDAVVPFATAAPETLTTATPAPTSSADRTPEVVEQIWRDDTSVDDTGDASPTPRPTTQPSSSQYEILMRGDAGTAVQKLQARLKALGYYSGTVDGDYGAGTVSAVKAFESACGQTQTGVASTSLQKKLFSDSAPYSSGVSADKPASQPKPTQKPSQAATPAPTSQYTQLSKGDAGSRVSKLQSRLKKLGYYSGDIDGDYGSATVSAIRRFQKALGIEQTGVATVALQKKLYADSAPYYADTVVTPAPTASSAYAELSRGDSGTRVKQLQRRLAELGYYSGDIDGDYGSATVNAVKRFEAAYGRTLTGIATTALQKKLYSDDALPYADGDDPEEESGSYVTLSPGDTGNAVKKLQQRLKNLGYFTGDVGGNYLTKTTDAVKRFQKALGLSQTGVATAALQKKLFASDAPAYADTATPAPSSGYTTLAMGDTGDAVKDMQQRLMDLGYYSANVNGKFGKLTKAAVMKFEAAYGKDQTGVATPALQKELFSPGARVYTDTPDEPVVTPATYKTLKNGSTGDAVKKLQQRLFDLGYYNGNVNGKYGSVTEAAVLLFQQALGMEGTGVATPDTQEMLFDDTAPTLTENNGSDADGSVLKKNSKGDAVLALQNRLVELGYLTSMAAVTPGTYDQRTVLAVIDAQLDRDVDADGEANEEFLSYIYSDAAYETATRLHEGG